MNAVQTGTRNIKAETQTTPQAAAAEKEER